MTLRQTGFAEAEREIELLAARLRKALAGAKEAARRRADQAERQVGELEGAPERSPRRGR